MKAGTNDAQTANAPPTLQENAQPKYYIRRRGEHEVKGPFTMAEFKAQVQSGQIVASEYVALRDSGQTRDQLVKHWDYTWAPISPTTGLEAAESQTPQQLRLIESPQPQSFAGPLAALTGLIIGLVALAASLYWMYTSGTDTHGTSETFPGGSRISVSINPLPSVAATICSFAWTAGFGWLLAKSLKPTGGGRGD